MVDKETQVEAKQEPSQETTQPYEIAYSTKEVTELLGVVSSTVRKYSIALESEGYEILRNALDRRIFTDKDVVILRKVKELIAGGTTVEKAVKIAIQERQDRSESQRELVPAGEQSEAVKKLLEYIEQQSEESRELHRKLDYVIEEMQTLKAAQIETAEAKEEVEPVKKKSLLSKLFRL